MEIVKSIKELFYPQRHICLFCKDNMATSRNNICNSCNLLIEYVDKPIHGELDSLDKIYYSVLYNRFIRDMLHSFKFEGKSYLYKAFGEILLSSIETKGLKENLDAITFVPIHRRKEAQRGYNQSKLLAEYLAGELKLPLLDKHLRKVKWTRDQSKLTRLERLNNLGGAFKVHNSKGIRGKKILLIDDIITTGATMEECSRTLLENGAKKIYGLVITSSRKQ